MFDLALHDPSVLDGGYPDRWRTELRILDLEAELARTRHELDVLRDTSARLLTAVLTKLNSDSTVDAAPDEIRQLAHLGDESRDPADDPITFELEKMQTDHGRSLARLDRRFRWFPSRAD